MIGVVGDAPHLPEASTVELAVEAGEPLHPEEEIVVASNATVLDLEN